MNGAHPNDIEHLLRRLLELSEKQAKFQREIEELRAAILHLQRDPNGSPDLSAKASEVPAPAGPEVKTGAAKEATGKNRLSFPDSTAFEQFVGTNLLNKIGIVILIVGIAIGINYAIDNEWLSPLVRILLGYLAGLGLLATAVYLRRAYHRFSAVLLSGAMAVLYFATYAAHAFYDLLPQLPAFALMAIITIATVLAALRYNEQVIAHIGLVGAYATPFLLSNNTGRLGTLFAYMALINGGILLVAVRRYWKPLYHAAFWLTWLIYAVSVVNIFGKAPFSTGFTYAFVFFIIFYAAFLSYKIINQEAFKVGDIFLLLANAFFFYGFGYYLLAGSTAYDGLLGAFTVANALLHFLVSIMVSWYRQADQKVYQFIIGLVLTFLTIAIPVQLDGNWVTLVWVIEAALLITIGKGLYRRLAMPVLAIAFISLLHDWFQAYEVTAHMTPVFPFQPVLNIYFLTGIIFVLATGFMSVQVMRFQEQEIKKGRWAHWVYIPVILSVAVLYFSIFLEIGYYWNHRYLAAGPDNLRPLHYKIIWRIIYSLLFSVSLLWVLLKRWPYKSLLDSGLGLGVFFIIVYFSQGLPTLMDLSTGGKLAMHLLLLRYLGYALVAANFWLFYRIVTGPPAATKFRQPLDVFLYFSLLVVLSAEWLFWIDWWEASQSTKLGLSIVWGLYAALGIGLGIGQRKRHLRITAIVLFGITLLKLFFYDIVHLSALAKTVVLVALGILFLFVSFLYNKYLHELFSEEKA